MDPIMEEAKRLNMENEMKSLLKEADDVMIPIRPLDRSNLSEKQFKSRKVNRKSVRAARRRNRK